MGVMNKGTVFIGAKGKLMLRRANGSLQRLGIRVSHEGKALVYDTRSRGWVEVTQPIKYGSHLVKVVVYDKSI